MRIGKVVFSIKPFMFMFDTFFILICFQVLFILKDLPLLPHFSSSKPQGKVKESKKKHGKA
jgi:hypothetical protein